MQSSGVAGDQLADTGQEVKPHGLEVLLTMLSN
jgi:hypothetical protein